MLQWRFLRSGLISSWNGCTLIPRIPYLQVGSQSRSPSARDLQRPLSWLLCAPATIKNYTFAVTPSPFGAAFFIRNATDMRQCVWSLVQRSANTRREKEQVYNSPFRCQELQRSCDKPIPGVRPPLRLLLRHVRVVARVLRQDLRQEQRP